MGRHRSPCVLTLTNQLETKGPYSRHIDAAPMSRISSCIDVEARVERAPDMSQTGPERPAAARRPLHDVEIFELLGHGAQQRSHTRQPKAKNTCRSKLRAAGHDLWPQRSLRGRTRRQQARGMSKAWPRHDKARPAARTYVWDINVMVGFDRGACT